MFGHGLDICRGDSVSAKPGSTTGLRFLFAFLGGRFPKRFMRLMRRREHALQRSFAALNRLLFAI